MLFTVQFRVFGPFKTISRHIIACANIAKFPKNKHTVGTYICVKKVKKSVFHFLQNEIFCVKKMETHY